MISEVLFAIEQDSQFVHMSTRICNKIHPVCDLKHPKNVAALQCTLHSECNSRVEETF